MHVAPFNPHGLGGGHCRRPCFTRGKLRHGRLRRVADAVGTLPGSCCQPASVPGGASVPGPSEATLSSHATRGRRVHRKRPRRTGVVWKCQLLARWHSSGVRPRWLPDPRRTDRGGTEHPPSSPSSPPSCCVSGTPALGLVSKPPLVTADTGGAGLCAKPVSSGRPRPAWCPLQAGRSALQPGG